MVRHVAIATGATGLVIALSATPASAEPPTEGGCQEFGAGNVAVLAQDPDVDFGATASFVASELGPQAFPNIVVFPEQERECG